MIAFLKKLVTTLLLAVAIVILAGTTANEIGGWEQFVLNGIACTMLGFAVDLIRS